jgi:hypothetical protein
MRYTHRVISWNHNSPCPWPPPPAWAILRKAADE